MSRRVRVRHRGARWLCVGISMPACDRSGVHAQLFRHARRGGGHAGHMGCRRRLGVAVGAVLCASVCRREVSHYVYMQ